MEESEFKLVVARALLDIQNRVAGLVELFRDNIDFIGGMGSVADSLADVLTSAMDRYDEAVRGSLEQVYRSSEFFKQTVSERYSHQNIVQEWFTDLVVDVVSRFSRYDTSYVAKWIDLKFKAFVTENGVPPGSLPFEERVEFGEGIFRAAVHELGADPKVVTILRASYIPFMSVYYLRRISDYPYYSEWVESLKSD